MKKLTVGDNSGTARWGYKFAARRASIAEIEEGEKVLVRFKDDFRVTDYKCYRLDEKYFRDDFDRMCKRYTGVFVRVEE